MVLDFSERWNFIEHLKCGNYYSHLKGNDKKTRKIRSAAEEKIFKDCPEEVARIDKEFGKHKVLKIYYGTDQDRLEIMQFLGIDPQTVEEYGKDE